MKKDEIILTCILGVLIGVSIIVGAYIVAHQEPTVIYVNNTNGTGENETVQKSSDDSSVASESSTSSKSQESSSSKSSGIQEYDEEITSSSDGKSYVRHAVAYNDGSQGDEPGYYECYYNEEGPISQKKIG